MSPSSWLKIETVCFSQTLESTYKLTQYHNPGEQLNRLYCCYNLKSYCTYSFAQFEKLAKTYFGQVMNKILSKVHFVKLKEEFKCNAPPPVLDCLFYA
jgi:hypothetical protein